MFRTRFTSLIPVILALFLVILAIETYLLQLDTPLVPFALFVGAILTVAWSAYSRSQARLTEQIERLQDMLRQRQGVETEQWSDELTVREKPVVPAPPEALVRACEENDCVIFIGGGLAVQAGLPAWREGLRSIVELAAREEPSYRWDSLRRELRQGRTTSDVEEIIAKRLPREKLVSMLRQTFDSRITAVPTVYKITNELPFSGVLSSNWDHLVENAFENRTPLRLTPTDSQDFSRVLRNEQFFVLKLHGDLSEERSVNFGPLEYRRAISDNPDFSRFVTSIFFSKTILFVGVSLEGIEDFLLAFQIKEKPSKRHFALVPSQNDPTVQVERFSSNYGIEILSYSPTIGFPQVGKFLEDLRSRIVKGVPVTQVMKWEVKTAHLEEVVLHNIGPFKNLDLKLNEKWNVLLGDNGCGKSTVLRAIALGLCGDDERAQNVAFNLLRAEEQLGSVELRIDGSNYKTELVRSGSRVLIRSRQVTPLQASTWLVVGFPALRGVSTVNIRGPTGSVSANPSPDDLMPLLTGAVDKRMDSLKQWIVNLHVRSEVNHEVPKSKLSSNAKLSQTFFGIMQEISPGVHFEFSHVDTASWEVMVRTEDGTIPIDMLSAGMSSMLSWVGTLLERIFDVYGEDKNPEIRSALVLLDEVDVHLHPRWQQTVIPLLKQKFPNLQVVATTHSPLIVGNLDAGEIYLLKRNHESLIEAIRLDSFRAWRADQILTGPPFEMESTRDIQTTARLEEYAKLLGKSRRNESEQRRFQELSNILGRDVPEPEETESQRELRQMFEKWLMEQLRERSEEERRKIRAEIDEYFGKS